MGAILEAQLDLYERSMENAGEFARLQLEEAITVGVGLFQSLLAEVQAFNSRPIAGSRAQMLNEGRAYHARYERMASQLERLQVIAEAMRARGVAVRGVEKLDAARSNLRTILAFSPDRLEESYQSLREGRLIPLSEIRDELRRRVHA
jgi:hypothetical protein